MGRNLPAPGIQLSFGSDATVNDHVLKSVAVYADPNIAAGATPTLIGKAQGSVVWALSIQRALAVETEAHIRFQHNFSTANGDWASASNTVPFALLPLGVTYNRGNVANDPVGYVNGAAVAVPSVAVDPVGAAGSDAGFNLVVGDTVQWANGVNVGWFIEDNTILTASDMNRHKWYGSPFGPASIDVYHPMWTDSTANQGTAVAPMTVGTSTMVALPRVERMFGACTGVGR